MERKRKMERASDESYALSMKKMNALAAYLPNKYSDVKQTKCIMC